MLSEADARGWRLETDEGRAKLKIGDETVVFRIDEIADKVPHTPTPKELAEKARRDRWGGSSQPWPTWDLSPSGRLALVWITGYGLMVHGSTAWTFAPGTTGCAQPSPSTLRSGSS